MRKITFIITFLLTINFSFGQIVAWEMDTNAGNEITLNSTTLDPNLNTSTLSRGSGINPSNLANSFSSNSFLNTGSTQATAISNNEYLEFQVSASSGFQVSLSTLDVNFRRSGTGPNTFLWQYSTDGVTFNNIGSSFSYNTNPNNGTAQSQIDLSVVPALQNVVFGTVITLRVYGWGATNTSGTFAIGRLLGNDLEVGGVVSPVCTSTVTWNGSWSGIPDSTTEVIIDANYDTANGGSEISFSACSLTINSGSRLTINNGDFVEIENNVTVDGQLYVETQGNFVQNNDAASFSDNSIGGVRLQKEKLMQNKFSYTLWSSPMSNEVIEDVLGVTPVDRRFRFEAANFIDLFTEIGNTNTLIAGPDDIDDDGDDWVAHVTGLMTRGVGYGTTGSEVVGPGGYPELQSFDFYGEFNNGVIPVPLINNSGGAYFDWNLVGNPYPGAISVDQFFSVNAGLVDVIYFWDQATPANSNSSGSQNNNFSVDDYAMINGIMEVGARAGSGTPPNRFIASGQGFFVEALNAGTLEFNNSMRSSGANNSQFFKGSNSKNNSSNNTNKLWVGLTSDNGISNQIGIGYADGATKDNDGSFYDTQRITSSGNAAILYSIIENDDKKFAIQGKSPSDLTENEIINLGFKTSINVATFYNLSIDKLDGAFLNGNTVYLKDNLLNTVHDLSASDYTFTSEVGEFNNRFQIGFSLQSLSIDELNENENNLSIIQLDNNRVNFKTTNSSIKTVIIYDLLGRELYNLKGQSNSEIYQLSNLKNSIYIAKVELLNGTTITKKAIKK